MPDQITSVVNQIGKVKIADATYIPKLGCDNHTPAGLFVPQSEQIILSNLRQVVESLANAATPVQMRTRFYENNPIPGAIWAGHPQNPILQNADKIMPAVYGAQQ
ncbi:unnamed protein product [Brassicogethes aeneus]|uniref:Uncharacterized protein n=1 Tax=Brassicogethes aeneus TaxID=1431903 RepID=A0A9P0BG20_BRAAE|nr:unnamed protein product [Brassicogethes aeneus]